MTVGGGSRAVRAVAIARRGLPAVSRLRRRNALVSCAEVASDLPRILDEGAPADAGMVAHVETCLRCQAELARYRRLVRLLHQLQATEVDLPAGFVADVLSVVEAVASRRVIRSVLTGRTLGYAGAAVAAGGAAAGLVALAVGHRRHAVTPGAGAIVMGPGMLGAQPPGGLGRPHGGQ